MKKVLHYVAVAITALILIALVTIVGSLISGLVIKTLWSWFVVTPFGLQPLSMPLAIGLGLLAQYMTYQFVPVKDTRSLNEQYKDLAISLLIQPGFTLLIGWILTRFI